MAQNDIVTLKVVGRYQGQNIVNSINWKILDQSSPETTVLENLCLGFVQDIEAAWLARHIDSYELVGYKAFNHTGAAKTPCFLPSGDAGGVVGEELPASVCRTITLYTASAKHRRRGRIMLSGTAVAMLNTDDGAVTSSEMSSLGTLGTYFTTSLTYGDDTFFCCIPPSGEDPVELIVDTMGRNTPSILRSRRIREFLVG